MDIMSGISPADAAFSPPSREATSGPDLPTLRNLKNPYTTNPRAIRHAFMPVFEKIDPLIAQRLRQPTEKDPFGYNEHLSPHSLQVFDDASKILALHSIEGKGKSPFLLPRVTNDPSLAIGAFMELGHDLGMMVDIKTHPDESIKILEKVCPQLVHENTRYWEMIKLGIQIHDSSSTTDAINVNHVLNHWLNPNEEPLFGFSNMQRDIIDDAIFKRAFCAFFFADKIDVGIARVPHGIKAEQRNDAITDPHMLVNTYARSNNVEQVTKNIGNRTDTQLYWNISLNPNPKDFSNQERVPYTELLTGLPPINTQDWLTQFNTYYLSRSRKAAAAAFALFPGTDTFVINIENTNKIDAPEQIRITRKEIQESLLQSR